jgi:hypothetical protein
MDNKLFNVNGRTKEQLLLAVKLLMTDEYGELIKIKGWYYDKQKGLVLTWTGDGARIFPFTDKMSRPREISPEDLTDLLWEWLQLPEAKDVTLLEDEARADFDGTNAEGWRLYTEEWGHIRSNENGTLDHYSLAAFKRVWCWYSK